MRPTTTSSKLDTTLGGNTSIFFVVVVPTHRQLLHTCVSDTTNSILSEEVAHKTRSSASARHALYANQQIRAKKKKTLSKNRIGVLNTQKKNSTTTTYQYCYGNWFYFISGTTATTKTLDKNCHGTGIGHSRIYLHNLSKYKMATDTTNGSAIIIITSNKKKDEYKDKVALLCALYSNTTQTNAFLYKNSSKLRDIFYDDRFYDRET